MELIASMIAFFALIAAWFVLPSAPPVRQAQTQSVVSEALPTAA